MEWQRLITCFNIRRSDGSERYPICLYILGVMVDYLVFGKVSYGENHNNRDGSLKGVNAVA